MTLHELVDAYLAARPNLHALTASYYRAAVTNLRTVLGREPMVSDLNRTTVANVKQLLADWRPSKLNRYVLKPMHSLWNEAARHGLLVTLPLCVSVDDPHDPPTPWTSAELKKLWTMLIMMRGMIGDCPAKLWWLALHAVVYDARCHHGLIVHCDERKPYRANGATWEDFDAAAMTLRIRPALQMRRDSFGVRRLDVTTVKLLERMGPQSGPIFHYPGDRKAFTHKYRRLANRVDMPVDQRGRFPRLRGTAPSFASAAGQDVRYGDAGRLLGDFLADHAATEGYGVGTTKQLGYGVARFGDFLRRPAELGDLTTDRLNRFVAWRLSGDVSSRTVENERKALKKLALAAAAKGYIEEPGKIERAVGATP